MRNQRGITLIALVITIIVLLILAGVSIAMLTGDNGILTRANQAAFKTAFATARENVANTINEAMTNHYGNVYVDDGDSTIATAIKTALTTAYSSSGTKDDGGATISYSAATTGTGKGTITISFDDKTQTGTVTESTGKVEWGAAPTAD